MEIEAGTTPVVKGIIFSTLALAARCHGHESYTSRYIQLTRAATETVTI